MEFLYSIFPPFLYILHVVVSIFLIGVVLLQQGKGADLAVFGGGASQAAFGARGAANILHRLTVGCFCVFIFTTLAIGIVQGKRSTSSVISDDAIEEPAAATDTADEAADEAEAAPAEAPSTEGSTGAGQDEAGADAGAAATDGEPAAADGDGSESPGNN